AGVKQIKLRGTGTPVISGTDEFTIIYNTSICQVPVTVLPVGASGPALFVLGSAPNVCPAVTVSGSYNQGTALTGSNQIQFQINVSRIGSFFLTTDTVNGFYFSAGGGLGTTGVQNITLIGSGTPLLRDSTTFRLRSGTTICTFRVAVGGTPPPPPPPGGVNCVDTVLGNYVVGSALNASNKVNVRHTYLTAGTFIISTDLVNGYSFKDTVVVTIPGTLASIQLNGAGTPGVTGINKFTISFGDGSNCQFNTTVTATAPPPPPPPVTNTTLFPLTQGSYWTYDDVAIGDTLKRAITDSAVRGTGAGAGVYKRFVETDMAGDTSHSFFRRTGNDYNEYAFVDKYSLLTFEEYIYDDILFLKENAVTGQTWTSKEWTGTDGADTTMKKLRYTFKCEDAGANASFGTVQFTQVHKISFKPQTAPVGSTTWTDEGIIYNAWFARGVGLITLRGRVIGGPTDTYELRIRKWNVQ
ncbi:MAG: hypothetical protein WKF70_05265, partial [Chitinophagaceae bacterium]